MNKIRNNSNTNETSSTNIKKSVDIFNDGLDRSESSSDSDSEDFNITEDDLRLEFAKSIDMKGDKEKNGLNFDKRNNEDVSDIDLGLGLNANKGGNGIKSLKNLK